MKISVVYHSETGNTEKMAHLIAKGAAEASPKVEARAMSVDAVDEAWLAASQAVIVGGPTYEGSLSWKAKRFLDEVKVEMAGKIGSAFASQNWPGGGGADFSEMVVAGAMLVRGMLFYTGGITQGMPAVHFGAVSTRAPEGIYAERCARLGGNIAKKGLELFGGEAKAAGPVKVAVVYHSKTGNTEKMAELIERGAVAAAPNIEARRMPVEELDQAFLAAADAVIVGGPTYYGGVSWNAKRFLDEVPVKLEGKLCGAFASQYWPGGGGADLSELNIIAAMLIRGMIIYSGGITKGQPFLHFGAVSAQSPEGLYAERCAKLGDNIAKKAAELFR